jgi:hypothetical protein
MIGKPVRTAAQKLNKAFSPLPVVTRSSCDGRVMLNGITRNDNEQNEMGTDHWFIMGMAWLALLLALGASALWMRAIDDLSLCNQDETDSKLKKRFDV